LLATTWPTEKAGWPTTRGPRRGVSSKLAKNHSRLYFLRRGLKVPRTHDVAFLLSVLAESIAVAPVVSAAALALAAIAPASRYPDDLMEISQNDAVELARASRLVFDWARDQCRPSQPSQ
jgi:HEPN domain-containing protein